MQPKEEISIRVTEKMQRFIEPIIELSMINTKAQFVQEAVSQNIGYIHSELDGLLNIRDFIKDMNSDVEWVNINIPETSLSAKLDINNTLDVSYRTELSDEYHSTLKRCSRSSGMSKSEIIRLCMVKKIYDMRDFLSQARQMKIEDRWTSLMRKLELMKKKLIDNIYYYFFHDDYIDNKLDDELEIKNIYYLKEYYKEFKDTNGYSKMSESRRGKEIISSLNTIKQKDIVTH